MPPESSTSPRVALIADDDEFFRMALSSILVGQLGFQEVVQTGSLDEALDVLGSRGDQARFALFDLQMPGMAGAASLRAVRELHPHIRVAVVSGSRDRRDILVALEAGVHGYVIKAGGAAGLAKSLSQILEGKIVVPPELADISAEPAKGASARGTSDPVPIEGGGLTKRQREVLGLITHGRSNKEIARDLDLGEGTVKIHVAALFRALGVNSRSAAAAVGARVLSVP